MKLAIQEAPLPKYIAVEGPIGVGKTTLANKLAETFNYDVLLEQPSENPFLEKFLQKPRSICPSRSAVLFISKNATNSRSQATQSF